MSPGDRRTVLFVSVPTGVGGSTRSLATVMASLDGEARRVLAGPPIGRFVGLVDEQGSAEQRLAIVDHRRSLRPLRRAWTSLRLAVWAVRHRKELAAIHANGLKEMSMSLPAAFVSRVPLVVWVHNFALPPSVRWFGWLWRLLLPRCHVRWAAVSSLAQDLTVGAGLATADQIEIVPNPIDPGDVLATDRTGGDRVAVAYLGAPRQYKGFHLLPEIIDSAGKSLPARWLVFSRQTDGDLDATWQRA